MNNEGRSAVFGTDRSYSRDGVSISRYSNFDITWETAYKTNLALEVGLFDKVQIMADFFREHRKNILMHRQDIPSTMGLSAPISANLGEIGRESGRERVCQYVKMSG